MPVINRLAGQSGELAQWRQHLHTRPELLFDVTETAAFVAGKLKEFGCDDVVTGIGRSGVVGVINGSRQAPGAGPVIGLRADMDALPIREETGKPYASRIDGKMHACGHDGHTTMLLGAARYLAETRNFAGKAVVVFQPAEEGGTGAQEMLAAGLMDQFGIEEIYGLHNWPGLPVGQFAIRPGPIMGISNQLRIELTGRGGHAAMPAGCIDTVMVGSQIVTALQTIVSRNVEPVDAAVVSIATFQAGDSFNVLPERAMLSGTCRALRIEVLDFLERRVKETAETIARLHGAKAEVTITRDSPATVNSPRQFEHALSVAEEVAGPGRVDRDCRPSMATEDFGFMLEARPGAFIFLGNGDSAGLHHPRYDFDDGAIPYGASWLARLVEQRSAG